MAPLLEDPRFRQTWNNISHNAETATESAAAGIWSFSHTYINPCLASIGSSFDQCANQCFPDREERARRGRERNRTRGRAEYRFDFYDDWDEDEGASASGGLLGWGNDELDRLLAGSGSHSHGGGEEQPSARKRGMSYGTGNPKQRARRGTVDGLPDPTIIPSTNSLGFLGRLPWKFGGTLRYKPSAADLQDHPGSRRVDVGNEAEEQPLIHDDQHSDDNDDDGDLNVNRTRQRSGTTGSGDTSDSFRSRGDLFPSDGEDDAVPLSDEFAMGLERRSMGSGMEDWNSGKTRSTKSKRRSGSRGISRTLSMMTQSSSRSRLSMQRTRDSSASFPELTDLPSPDVLEMPSMTELQQEEERVRKEEEDELERKREAALRLAAQKGLNLEEEEHHAELSKTEIAQDKILKSAAPKEVVLIKTSHITGSESPAKAASKEEFVPARLPNF